MEYRVTKKNFILTWFSGTGAGGQHRNRHMNCCRLKHVDTGVVKTGQSHRSRAANQAEALNAIAKDPRFLAHAALKLRELERGETTEQRVEKMMRRDNLLIETKDENGNWTPAEDLS